MKKNYSFDWQVGDGIFPKGRKDVVSFLVRKETKGYVSHVEGVVGKLKYDKNDRITISSNAGIGVHYDSLQRYEKNNVSFETWRYIDNLTPEQKAEWYLALKKFLGQKYDYAAAMGFTNIWIRKIFGHAKNRQICSEVYTRAYNAIGIDISGKKPENTSPIDIIKFGAFIKVHDTDIING